ncbi:hypothetical protein KRP22_011648 [Phytophthora ramorum]|nr:hypothetical protein KRP22_11480 [Phytophthora ramorum]
MDYLASNLSALHTDEQSTNENLHEHVQTYYSKVVALFDYGRALADLVQGISVIETSSGELMPEAAQMTLEVNIVGRNLLQEVSKATSRLQSSNKVIDDLDTCVSALQDDIKRKQTIHGALASTKSSAEFEFRSLCDQFKNAAGETARMLGTYVKEMRHLLKGFDKFKTPSKPNRAGAATTGSESVRRQRQLQTEQHDSLSSGHSSPTVVPGYTFMENDRLVRILLRSIRSVNHLQQLEGVLERHGEVCAALRETVGQIDLALRKFDADADKLLTVGSGHESPLLQFLIDLVEALEVVKSQPESEGTPDENPVSLLVRGRDLVRGCVKLFFEATEMADRFSSAEDENLQTSGGVFLPDDGEEEEQRETGDTPLALESGNSVALANGSDSDSSSYDLAVNSRQSVEEKSQYGLQVLKRIEEKLSGTVTEMADAPPVLTVEQQASWLIDESTKTDNLCVMYEGWTPWI